MANPEWSNYDVQGNFWWRRLAKFLLRVEKTSVYTTLEQEAKWLQDNFPGDR